jgi:tetratricopeptide (TPR) repeat protein
MRLTGKRRDDEGDQDGALEAYAQASAIHPGWAVPWYNTGLIHKYRGEWAASLQANARAVQCEPGNEGALWNLGIAATALGDWTTARRAWRQYGIGIPEGEGPVDYFVGLTPIRVHGDEGTEVVWADRIDPARAILRNVPTPACGHRYGDLVLHDGAPNGYRLRGEREMAVFDALEADRAVGARDLRGFGGGRERGGHRGAGAALQGRGRLRRELDRQHGGALPRLLRRPSLRRGQAQPRRPDEAPGYARAVAPGHRLARGGRRAPHPRRMAAATSPKAALHDFRCVLPATPRCS